MQIEFLLSILSLIIFIDLFVLPWGICWSVPGVCICLEMLIQQVDYWETELWKWDVEMFWGEKCKLFVQADHGVQVVVGFCQFKVVCGECVHANNQISHDGLTEVPIGWDPTLSTH
jgi:hypothetical protein